MMVDELEKTKDSLWSTADGRLPSADTVVNKSPNYKVI